MTIHTPLQMGADPPAEGYFFFEMWVLSIVLYKAYFGEFGGIFARK